MRLRSLEIQGFKSFPDKTRLTFRDGITAVVGPNGSGKSNIADAMRWVLGEQSTKTLRGDKMEDVIFGGTQSRKAQGFSQVQLTIDNTDRALAYDSDEVSVTRKLYRSGESDYRINNVAVRLRDVNLLFMDTGLGKDGYSMIGQGKIAEIVGAKSNQRREIFEEAAGISKHRFRRQEAQRSLQGAEENLTRLLDILEELENRVEPLRVQSEKAARFLELAAERKTWEISLWVRGLEELKGQLRAQEDKYLLCKQAHDAVQGELDSLEEKMNALYAQMQSLSMAIEQRRAQQKQLEEQAAQSASDLAVLENDARHNEEEQKRLGAQMEQSGASGEELARQLADYRTQIAAKQQAFEEMQQARRQLQDEEGQLLTRQNECLGKIDALKERRYVLTQSLNEVKLSTASSTSLIEETAQRLQILKEGALIKEENLGRIQKERTDCMELLEQIGQTIVQLQNTRQGYELKLSGRHQKEKELLAQRQKLEDMQREKLQRAKVLTDMENSLEGFSGSVKYVMNQVTRGALKDVYGPVSKLIQVDEKYALAIEIALGASMQNIVVKDEGTAKRAIHMLKESRAGRATFLPVSAVRGNRLNESWLAQAQGFLGLAVDLIEVPEQFTGVMNQLLGRVVIVEDLDCATAIAKRGGYRFRAVTLDGQVVNAGGSMTGGYAAKSAGILSRSREIDALKQQAEQFNAQIAALDGELKTLREAIALQQAQLSGLQGELATAQEDKIRYEAQLQQLHILLDDTAKQREQTAKEYDTLAARLEELKSQNVTDSGLIKDMDNQIQQVAAELLTLGDEREQLQQQRQTFVSRKMEQELACVSITKEIDTAQQLMRQLEGQQSDERTRLTQLEEQLTSCRDRAGQIQASIENTRRLQEEQVLQSKECQEMIAGQMKERNEFEAKTSALRAEEKGILERRESAARDLVRMEEKKAAIQTDYDGLIARLWEEYELTRSQADELAQPVEDMAGVQRRLIEVKAEIKSLGSVNVAAIDEYKEVYARYKQMKEQMDDVQQSRDELLALIDKLTMDMQNIFAAHFEQIAAHFSEIFVQLFGGGRASLTLTEPNNLLESGIDIHVQPPGKLVGNLALLSGGEQALVAICIYFAILKVRPSPFVLLDEIEAALDDVNVVKYAQYLRTLCERTQFIAITHRRGTMEEADVLYGVTMQEEGVSKLLELDVSEIESKLGMH